MDINDLFSQLKTIEPRKEFSVESRRLVLASSQHQTRFNAVKNIFIDTFRMGTAIALAAALVLVIVNATFLWKILPAPQVAVLDPVGLHAEAQAIDIQIQLAQINFGDLAMHTSTASTAAIVSPSSNTAATKHSTEQTPTVSSTIVSESANTIASAPTPTSTDIDSALQELSK